MGTAVLGKTYKLFLPVAAFNEWWNNFSLIPSDLAVYRQSASLAYSASGVFCFGASSVEYWEAILGNI